MNLSPFVRRVVAPAWAWHERSPYLKVACSLKKGEHLSLAQRQADQWLKLIRLLEHAYNESPYYRKKFASVGYKPGDLKNWEDLRRLPILTKRDIVDNATEMISQKAKRKTLVPRKTSGSTGISLNFYVDDDEFQFKRGVELYRNQWTGWELGEWKALVWGNPAYLDTARGKIRNYLLERCFSLDTLKMDEAMMASFASQIFKLKPSMLFGHAHSLYLFARFWREQKLPDYRFRGILSTAMVLHEHERQLCESVFQTPVFNRYGCEEVSLIASECASHQGLHINTDSLIVELVKDEHFPSSGDTGRVIVTDLCNMAMPFIRYEVGDTATASDQSCSCGRTYPLLKSIAGRVADYLRTPEGDWISGISLTENFATLIPGIHQIQIVQDEADLLRLRIVRSSAFNQDSEACIIRMIHERFGLRMRVAIDYVDAILPEPSGKYRFSIYKVGTSASD
jgi:phenylacetate-CoA ligase